MHKSIVCPRSEFSAAACRGDFTVSLPGGLPLLPTQGIFKRRPSWLTPCCRFGFFPPAAQEAREGRISLPEDDVQIVDLMIYYLYHLDYHVSQPPGDDTQPKEELTGWELPIHVKVYGMAEKYGAAGLKAVAELKFKATANLDWHHNNLIRAAREAYESTVETDRSLRDVVTIKLVNRPKLLELEEVQNLLREVPMLAYDLLMLTYRTQSHLWA